MKILINCALAIVMIGCSNPIQTGHNDQQDIISDYTKIYNFFGDSLINHIPKELVGIETIDTFAYHNTVSFFLTSDKNKVQIDSVLMFFSKKILKEYSAADSCLIVVNDYVDTKNFTDPFRASKSIFIEGCSNGRYAVPNFWGSSLATEETRSKLSADFMFYILDSKKGIYSNKIKAEQSSMPDFIKHGYSRGFAVSRQKNIFIYWVIIW